MLQFIKKPVFTILTILVVGGLVLLYIANKDDAVPYEFVIAELGDIVQEVSVTGRVEPKESVDLAFEKTGRVSWIAVEVGDNVGLGQTLIQLENSDIEAQIFQAKAQVRVEQAKLDELKRGTREEALQVQEVKVGNAEIALSEARQNLVNKLFGSYTKADDAVRNKVDQFMSNSRSSDPQIDFQVKDSQLERDIETNRTTMEELLISWDSSIQTLTIKSDLSVSTDEAKANLAQVKSFLNNVALAVNDLKSTVSLSQATIDGYRADVSTARTNVNTATSNISAALEKLKDDESALNLARQELVLKEAGATPEEIRAQEAKIEENKAIVNRYQVELGKTILRTPISGVVVRQNVNVGEIVATNEVVVSLISAGEFEIKANVPEADIAKIKKGNISKVTLDAYGGDVIFEARIVTIDPAETVIDGVPTYKTVLQFSQKDDRVRSGMTANLDILTDEREGVITVPIRAVILKDGKRIVRVVGVNGVEDVEVEVGLRGSSGNIEIVAGVDEGDKVITFLREK